MFRQSDFIRGCETELPQYCQKVIHSSVTKPITTPPRNGAFAGVEMAKKFCEIRFVNITWTGMLASHPITEVLNYPDIVCRNRTGISGG
jgi:hypothetical protein